MRILDWAAVLSFLAPVGTSHRPTPAGRVATLPPAHVVEIVGLDYAFQVPSTLPAGRTTFRFVNRGKVAHELNVSLLKREVTVQQFMAAVNADMPRAPLREAPVGIVFAKPGERAAAALSTELLPGRTYVVICINQDTPKAKPHSAMGMYAAITVSRAPVVPPTVWPATARRARPEPADTIVASDYAFIRAPRTLAPGHHRFAFANRGSFRHEVNMFVLKPGVTLLQAMDVQKAGGEVGAITRWSAPSRTTRSRPRMSCSACSAAST